MLRTTLAGLRMHKGRLVTTALAIILGVTFVAGTLVFTDTMRESYRQQATGSATSVDTLVLPEKAATLGEREEGPLDAEAIAELKDLPETGAVQGITQGPTPLLGKDGKAIGQRLSSLGMTVSGDVTRYEPSEGRLPGSGDEVILSTQLARKAGYGVGDTVQVLDHSKEQHSFEVVGLVDFGLDQEVAFRGAVGFTPETAKAMTGVTGFAEIDILGAEGVPAEELKSAVADVADGDGVNVWTGQEYGEQLAEDSGAQVQVFTVALMLFAIVAVFVSALVIFNTFAILIAQRQREMAMLRCVGATRGQVFRSVLIEALFVGLVASVLGVAGGVGIGIGGMALMGQFNEAMSSYTAVINPATVVIGMLVGTLVTLVSALLPALRATRVAPLAALRTSAASEGAKENRTGWVRITLAALFLLASGAIVAVAMGMDTGETPMMMVVGSGLVCFIGVMFISPMLVRAMTNLVGWPLRKLFGVPTELAVQNAQRSPKRAATAMIALTVGATLISGFSVISASSQATVGQRLDEQFPVDYMVQTQLSDPEDKDAGIPAEVAKGLRDEPGVAEAYSQRETRTEVGDGKASVGTILGTDLSTQFPGNVAKGSLEDLGPDTVAVSEASAGISGIGDTVEVGTAEGTRKLEVVAILKRDGILPSITMAPEAFTGAFPDADTDAQVFVKAADGAQMSDVRTEVEAAISDYPTVSISSATQLKEQYAQNMENIFYVIAGLLGLAIIIAIFGIANTMALSVLERTRESALLRAMGLAKSQLRRMLSVEAILISVIGALLGVGLGVLFGWATIQVMVDDVIFTLPVLQVGSFILVAILAGLLSGVLPSRRAAKTSITGALASE